MPPPASAWPGLHWRLATLADTEALRQLIEASVRELQADSYLVAQREATLGTVFGVDAQLIADATYLVAEVAADGLVAVGGWSFRRRAFGAGGAEAAAPFRDVRRGAAIMRAFFVHPRWARRGLGTALLGWCEASARAAGYRRAAMVATLAGEPLYRRAGYVLGVRYAIPLAGGLRLPVVRLAKKLS